MPSRTHYHRMISELVSQIVMDRRGSVSAGDFSSTYGVSVGNLIQQFSDLDELNQLKEEAAENREKLIRLSAENKELQLENEHLRSLQGQGSSTPLPSETQARRKYTL